MRNLKRALSLALASVMLLGMMVVGTSAASYPDVDEKDNVEAIEVLNAVKVMIGDRGNFRPDAAVNRHEMAVIMAKLVLGNEAADNYVGSHPFTDVFPWADKYVAACYENGLVSGTSATTFSGNQPLTAVQAAAMMLRALGYKDLSKGASDWRAPVTAMANQIRLFSGVASNPKEELDRNQVAQLALNTLKSPVVDLKDGTFDITSGDGNVIITGGSREYIVRSSRESYAYAINNTESSGNSASGVQGATVELGEHLYNGKLRLNDGTADDFDRPSRTWEYDGKEIGTYAKDELLRREYTVGVTGKDLYDLLSASTIKDYDVAYYVDGVLDDETIKASNMIRTNTKTYDTTGKGVLTQVFVDNNKREITIVSIHTYLAQATADYNAKKGTVSLNVYKTAGGVSKTADVEVVSGIEGIKKDDYILVNWAEIGSKSGAYGKMEVVKVYDPEVLEDQKLNKYSHESYVMDNGTQYDYGKDGVQKNDLGAYNGDLLKDFTYNLYFDQYGYMAGVIKHSGEDHYLFLTGYDRPTSNLSMSTADAAAIFLDGTMQTIKVNVTETDKKLDTNDDSTADQSDYPLLKQPTGNGDPNYNKWFKYTTKGEGDNAVYTLTPIAAGSWLDVAHGSAKNINTASVRLVGTNTGTPVAWGNDDSVFITVEAKDAAVDGSASTGDSAITKVKDVYNGMDDTDLEPVKAEIEATYFTGNIFAVMDDDKYVIGAVVVGDAKGSNKDYAYAIKEAKSEWIDGDYTYWDFTAVVNGEIKDLTVKDEYGDTITKIQGIVGTGNIAKSGLVKLTYDKDGYVIDAVLWATKNANTETSADKVYENSNYGVPDDVDPDTFNAYNVRYDSGVKLTGDGRTLYTKTVDPGLRLAQNAPVIVIQVEQDSKGNKEIVYDSYSSLLSARQELVTDTSYKGWVSAVIGDKGAEYIVIKENTVKSVTTNDPSIGGGDVEELELPSGVSNGVADVLVKESPDGAYVPTQKFKDMGGDADDNRIFKFTMPEDGTATLTIRDSSGDIKYAEAFATTKGPHYFYVQVTGTGFVNAGDGAMKNTALGAGNYNYKVTADGKTLLEGKFTIGS